MADIFLGEFDVDILPPVVTDRLPAPGAVDVDLFTDISFNIADQGGSTVDLASIDVSVGGAPAVVAGSIQPGFGGSITPIAFGYSVFIDPDDPLSLDTVIEVTVDAADLAAVPNIMPTDTWSFSTSEGLIVSPSLVAASGDNLIQVDWSMAPPTQALQEVFQLRKSLEGEPTAPDEGVLIYEGTAKSFLDTDVVNGTRYFYTVFVVRKYVLGVPEYIPYEPQASGTAVPRKVTSQVVTLDEYVPSRGEFGRTTHPASHGELVAVWGRMVDGVRVQSDQLSVKPSRQIQSPMKGTVKAVEDLPGSSLTERLQYVEVVNDRGMIVRVSGFLPLPAIVPGLSIDSGQVMGRTTTSKVDVSCFRQATGRFGLRTVRPSYFFLTVESRDGTT